MGSPADEVGRDIDENQIEVTLTKDLHYATEVSQVCHTDGARFAY